MPSVWVVPAFNEAEDFPTRGCVRIESGAIDEFAFEGGEEALAHGVVVAISDRSHGGSDTSFKTAFSECDRGVLAPLVGVVDDIIGSPLFEGHVEC